MTFSRCKPESAPPPGEDRVGLAETSVAPSPQAVEDGEGTDKPGGLMSTPNRKTSRSSREGQWKKSKAKRFKRAVQR